MYIQAGDIIRFVAYASWSGGNAVGLSALYTRYEVEYLYED